MVMRIIGFLLALCASSYSCSAQNVDYYKGKTIKLLVGSAAGSGYDLNARLVARFLPHYLNGQPSIVVQNQPGAGSAAVATTLYNSAPRDGTYMGASINGMPTIPLFSPELAHFDPTQFEWIGSSNRDTQISYVWSNSGVTTIDDLFQHELVVGATTPGTTQVDFPLVARSILGLKYRVVSGYEGTTNIHLAMERGEVQGVGANAYLSLRALNSNWINDKKVRIIMQYGLKAHPDLADVPTIFSLVHNDEDRQALTLLVSRLEYGRPFFMPPKVSPALVGLMRRAFDATMRDKEFLAEAEKEQLEISAMSGEEVAELVTKVNATPPAIVERVKHALQTPP